MASAAGRRTPVGSRRGALPCAGLCGRHHLCVTGSGRFGTARRASRRRSTRCCRTYWRRSSPRSEGCACLSTPPIRIPRSPNPNKSRSRRRRRRRTSNNPPLPRTAARHGVRRRRPARGRRRRRTCLLPQLRRPRHAPAAARQAPVATCLAPRSRPRPPAARPPLHLLRRMPRRAPLRRLQRYGRRWAQRRASGRIQARRRRWRRSSRRRALACMRSGSGCQRCVWDRSVQRGAKRRAGAISGWKVREGSIEGGSEAWEGVWCAPVRVRVRVGWATLAFPSALRSKVERMRTELETERLELEHRLLAQVPHPLGSPLFLSSPLPSSPLCPLPSRLGTTACAEDRGFEVAHRDAGSSV
jgi:hypothetical protein